MGLMGEIASTVYAGLGEENVIGVIPEALQPREVHPLNSLQPPISKCQSAESTMGHHISARMDT